MRMTSVLLVYAFAAAACCERPCKQRGWVGGEFRSVKRCGHWLEPAPPAVTCEHVIGMPRNTRARCGLLCRHVPPGSPLAGAGVQPGDLLLAVDGQPVGDPWAFRKRIENTPPGSHVTLCLWRDGSCLRTELPVGRETYRETATVGVYLAAYPYVDLWPFDDGIDVLGLVVAKCRPWRHDLCDPDRTYLARAQPGCRQDPVRQEALDFRLLPLSFGTHTEVCSQRPVGVPTSPRAIRN